MNFSIRWSNNVTWDRGHANNLNTGQGYGYATDRATDALTQLGYDWSYNEPSDVHIWFDQPHHWKFDKNSYKIGYCAWESTQLKDDWVERMNVCDEIWTPSPLIADWYRADGVTPPIYVYEHGVDPVWKPVQRECDTLRFLHIGAEAARKGGYDVLRAFRKAFPNNDDVELTLKMVDTGWNIDRIGRTSIVNKKLTLEELIALHTTHHVFVYPSWGEGFGLTPLQAMATGMPTITVPAWAPYHRFLDPNLQLSSKLKKSPWQEAHPGQMFRVDQDDLVDKMRFAYENYDDCVRFANDQLEKIQLEYDWLRLTESVFGDLEKRLNL